MLDLCEFLLKVANFSKDDLEDGVGVLFLRGDGAAQSLALGLVLPP